MDAYTARSTLRVQVKDLLAQIPLTIVNGQYQHDDFIVYAAGVERVFKSLYNPLQPGQGMSDLLKDATNALNSIKSTDLVDANTILKEAKKEAAILSKQTGLTEKPAFETRSDAQEEADRRNFAYQAAIGAKEGAAEAITEKVGSDITDSVLRNTDGKDMKGVDEWSLFDVLNAAKQGAIRPNTADILSQLIEAINYRFDFRKKVATNMEQLNAKTNRIASYGINHDDSARALTLLANIEYAAKHDWGREFRPVVQDFRRKYPYNHKHDAQSIAYLLQELAAADTIRILTEAPEPTPESANAVADSVSLLTEMMQASHDYEESAFAAQSDSESSKEQRKQRSGRTSNRNRRNRSKSRDSRNSGGSKSINKDCPHCTKYKRRKKHPNVPNDKCFWNKAYKGYRAKWICDEMELKYAGRHKFSSDMGGYPSDSEEE